MKTPICEICAKRTMLEKIKRLWPPYRRKREAETKTMIRWLVENPDEPCVISGHFIPHGYGERK